MSGLPTKCNIPNDIVNLVIMQAHFNINVYDICDD